MGIDAIPAQRVLLRRPCPAWKWHSKLALVTAVLLTACARTDADLRRFDHDLHDVDRLLPSQGLALDPTRMPEFDSAMCRLGTSYLKLNPSNRAVAIQRTPDRLHWLLAFGIMMAKNEQTIAEDWSHPRAFYTQLSAAARSATPADGREHAFRVERSGTTVVLRPLPGIPEGRGASNSLLMARVIDGKLTAACVMSDMGHAGMVGILFSDEEIPLHTPSSAGGPRYWIFSTIGEEIYPHVYQAWNDLD